jgi:hypothetical protein
MASALHYLELTELSRRIGRGNFPVDDGAARAYRGVGRRAQSYAPREAGRPGTHRRGRIMRGEIRGRFMAPVAVKRICAGRRACRPPRA